MGTSCFVDQREHENFLWPQTGQVLPVKRGLAIPDKPKVLQRNEENVRIKERGSNAYHSFRIANL